MIRLIKWFTLPGKETCARIVWFTEYFGDVNFEGVDAVLLHFLKYCADLGIIAKRKFLEAFLKTEGKQCIKENNIKLDSMTLLDYSEPSSLEEAYRVIASATLARFDQCQEETLEDRVFKVDMRTFIETQKSAELQHTMAEVYPKLMTGNKVDDIVLELQSKLDKISIIYDSSTLEKLDFLEGHVDFNGNSDSQRFLFKTSIPCIDGDIGGMYSKQLWTFTGPPGGGKTRFALIHFAYQSAVYYKQDVLVDELELTKGEVENILIAYHITNLYKGKIKIPDKNMNQRNLTEEQQRYYEAAKMDLFCSGKYGKIVVNVDGLDVESVKKKRLQYFRLNRKTQLWVIDYLGLFISKPIEKFARHLQKYEVITDGIKTAKEIAKIADIGVLCVCQYNDEGSKASELGKTITPGMVEGGHIIQRHSDYDIAMTMTPEQKLAKMRSLSIVKMRAAAGFNNVPLRTDLSVSIFKQMEQQINNSNK